MSMIRTTSYKVAFNRDGSIYSESMEMMVEHDSMALSPDQLNDATARIAQLKGAMAELRRSWDPALQQEALSDQAKHAAPQRTIDGTKQLDMTSYDRNKPGWTKCPKCGRTDITHDQKPPKKGTWQGCYDCGMFLNADGTTAEMKKQGV